jgi:hypothetical protein
VDKQDELVVRQMVISVIVKGDWVIPIDREGNRIGAKMLLEKVGVANQEDFQWGLAVKRMHRLIEGNRSLLDPWERKISTLLKSAWIRLRDQPSEKTKRDTRFETLSWCDAIPRLYAQAKNHSRRAQYSSWHRWSENISRNHKKKMR